MYRAIFKVFFLLTLGSTALGAHRGAYDRCFALEGDYLFLRRAKSSNKDLAISREQDPSTSPRSAKAEGKPILQSKELVAKMDFSSGFSLALKVFQNPDTTWEARYSGGFGWEGKKSADCLGNLDLAGKLRLETVDYQKADRAGGIYRSELTTSELNLYRHITPPHIDYFSLSWLAGLRLFTIDEKLTLFFEKNGQTSHYRVAAEDRPFGMQLGGSFSCNPYPFLTWGVSAKVGGMFNRGKQKTRMGDQGDATIILHNSKSQSNFSYMVELSPFLELRPTKHFFITCNYQVLSIGGIASAESNINLNTSNAFFSNRTHVIYHGLTGGIQFNF